MYLSYALALKQKNQFARDWYDKYEEKRNKRRRIEDESDSDENEDDEAISFCSNECSFYQEQRDGVVSCSIEEKTFALSDDRGRGCFFSHRISY